LYGKEEKEKGYSGSGFNGGSGLGKRLDVAGKLRIPMKEPLEFIISDMSTGMYNLQGFVIYPLRSLLPPLNLARYLGK